MGHVALKKALPAYVNALSTATNDTRHDSGVRHLEPMKDHVLLEVNGRSVLGLVKHQREIGFAGEPQLSTACDVMLENVLHEALKSSEAMILKFALFNKSPPKPQPQVFHPARQQELVRYTSTIYDNPLHDEMNRLEAHDGQTRIEHATSVVESLSYANKNKKGAHRKFLERQQDKDVGQVLAESKNETKEEEEVDAKPYSRPIDAASTTSPLPKVVKKKKRKTYLERQSTVERQLEMTPTNEPNTKLDV
jgi:hypothetical protein